MLLPFPATESTSKMLPKGLVPLRHQLSWGLREADHQLGLQGTIWTQSSPACTRQALPWSPQLLAAPDTLLILLKGTQQPSCLPTVVGMALGTELETRSVTLAHFHICLTAWHKPLGTLFICRILKLTF